MDDGKTKETEWWWIDYLESELEQGLEKDLELLLEHSQEDRDSFENFRLLRQWVRESDPIANWPLEDRMTRMRAGVMKAIQTLSPEPKTKTKTKSHSGHSSRPPAV
jgi:hypothetical protein